VFVGDIDCILLLTLSSLVGFLIGGALLMRACGSPGFLSASFVEMFIEEPALVAKS